MTVVAAAPKQSSVERKLQALIRQVLKERLGEYGYEDADIRFGTDADGYPAILVRVKYRLSKQPIDPRAILDTNVELRRTLLRGGEERVPIVMHRFDENQKVKGFG